MEYQLEYQLKYQLEYQLKYQLEYQLKYLKINFYKINLIQNLIKFNFYIFV